MTMFVTEYMTSATFSKKSDIFFPCSPAMMHAIPKNSANTIICSMLALTMAAMGLVGKMSRMTSTRGLASRAVA